MLSLHDCVFIYCFAYLFGSCILQVLIRLSLNPKFGLEFLLLNKAVFKQNMIWLHHLATVTLAASVAVVRQEFHSASSLHNLPLLQFSPLAYLLPSLFFWSTALCYLLLLLPSTDLYHLFPPAGQDPNTGWGLEYARSTYQSGWAHLPKEVSETWLRRKGGSGMELAEKAE